MKITRRQFVLTLSALPCMPRVVRASAEGVAAVVSRRILIPGPGGTIPALIFRPRQGRYPGTIALPASYGEGLADADALYKRCASQAACGYVVVFPLKPLKGQAQLAAVRRYTAQHPSVAGAPEQSSGS